MTVGGRVHIVISALKDIAEDEEILLNYKVGLPGVPACRDSKPYVLNLPLYP